MTREEIKKRIIMACKSTWNEKICAEIEQALEQEPCDDAISREDALMALTGEWTESRDEILSKAIRRIKALPSVTPQPKTGHWIAIDEEPHEDYECDRCGYTILTYDANIEPYTEYKYCPNCGAKMEGWRMPIDEAIKHAEEVAEEQKKLFRLCPASESDLFNCDGTKDCRTLKNGKDKGCQKCAEEHRQLAEWLRELKQLREQTKWTPVSEKLPKENGWHQCTVVINDLPRTMELFYKNDKWLDNRRIDMFNTYDIYGYGCTNEKHKLSYQELISEFDWTENVAAWMPLPEPYKVESED